MEGSLNLSRQLFLECDWRYDSSDNLNYGYSSISQSLQASANLMKEKGKINCANVLNLLDNIVSMLLAPDSINEPFKPMMWDIENGRRTLLPEDLTLEEVSFFEEILDDINEPYLKARIADLIWLLKKPRSVNYAKIAIDSYIATANCSDIKWNRGVSSCFERGARLCLQIKDHDGLEKIKKRLFSELLLDSPDNKFLNLSIAKLMHKLKIDNDIKQEIASIFYEKAIVFNKSNDFLAARSYFEMASIKYHQSSDEDKYIQCLIGVAESYELEGDARGINSNLIANSLYESTIQAYRKIPAKNRAAYSIDDKISLIRSKITESGKASIQEMPIIKTEGVNISEVVKLSIDHVKEKKTPEEALVFFINLFSGLDYFKIMDGAKNTLEGTLFGSLFGVTQLSKDGRVVARIPVMNRSAGDDDPVNKNVLHSKIYKDFLVQVEFVVISQILPALRQLVMEHRFTKDLMISTCLQSQLVPEGRENLLGYALWLGIEEEFGAAIHLLCPQVEHIVRTELKKVGAHTTTIDSNGIENENGLSTLMELPEAEQIFGKSLAFEIRSIFTESLGSNLRNEVAHGLLDDNSSSSIYTVYAWWMILRLVILSIINGNIKRD